jgi:acyl dehydratase
MKSIPVGEKLPELTRKIDLTNMIAYAGATWDWHRVHYDPEFIASRKIPAPIVDGQALGAIVVEAIQDWLGPNYWISRLSFRFASMVFAGETVKVTGVVGEAEASRLVINVEVNVEERLVLSHAVAEVTLR